MTRIRASMAVDAKFKQALGTKPNFIKRIGHIRRLRRALHHLDDDILKMAIPSGMPTYLMATGDTLLRGDGQEVKSIDRLQIGQQRLLFADLAAWLSEMVSCAKSSEAYDWRTL